MNMKKVGGKVRQSCSFVMICDIGYGMDIILHIQSRDRDLIMITDYRSITKAKQRQNKYLVNLQNIFLKFLHLQVNYIPNIINLIIT